MFTNNSKLYVTVLSFNQAAAFVNKHHRHNKAPVGCIFCLGLWLNLKLIGVSICGRPVSRFLDDKKTIEVTRLCVLENYPNACSKLYGYSIRTAKAKGFTKIITYTLQSENGSSLKAANFILESEKCGGLNWTGKRKYITSNKEFKKRWVYIHKN